MKKLLPRLLAAVLFAFSAAAAAAPQPLDRILVIVNDGVILQSDLDSATAQALSELKQRNIAEPPADVLRQQVLEHLIMQKIQTERAAQAGIRVDDRELNDVLTNIAEHNGMSLAAFADAVKKEGMDYLALREQVRDQLLATRLRQKEVDSRIVVTDQDIDQFLATEKPDDSTEYRLSHILVAVPDGASPELRAKARAKAEGLLKQLRGGADFAQLAIAHSDGQQALKGGDLGWRKSTDLPPQFADAVAKLHKGGLSDLIETAGGFHIVKLADERGGEQRQTVEETHVRHILIKPNEIRNEDQSRALARDIYDRLKRGEDFAKLAQQYSDDTGSRNGGGDLGWQPPGTFVPEFQKQIDDLKPNEISTPFHSRFGWHIAEVLGRRTRDITQDSRRAHAHEAIMERKVNEEADGWLRRLRDEAYVEYLVPSDAAAAAAAKL